MNRQDRQSRGRAQNDPNRNSNGQFVKGNNAASKANRQRHS